MMPIKGIFNQNRKNEENEGKRKDFEKQIMRLNTLEVQVKRLFELEKKISPLLSFKSHVQSEKEKINALFQEQKKKIEQAERKKESYLSNQLHSHEKKLADLHDKINILTERSFEKENTNIEQTETLYLETLQSTLVEEIEESILKKISPYLKNMDMINERILNLEKSISLLNKSQAYLLQRLTEISEKVMHYENGKEAKQEQVTVIKEIKIDKFFLDKYEQNNNFAQLGIKELSGTLNIGATYEKGIIPEQLTNQIKEDIKEMRRNTKNEADNNTESFDDPSSEVPFNKEEFTDIPIEKTDKDSTKKKDE